MIARDEVLRFLDEFLAVATVRDHGPQGLQVEGKVTVSKIATGVSASLELFERAAALGADLIIVHHGLLWDRDPRTVTGIFRNRLKLLLEREISLAAYHLPLDRHPAVGHSAQIARRLDLIEIRPFGSYRKSEIGVRGQLAPPLSISELASRAEEIAGSPPIVFAEGPDQVTSVAVVSGGAWDMVSQAVEAGLDAFVTGEAHESTPAYCREAGIHYIAMGHYNSEKPGIVALGDVLRERFGIPVEFVDIPNPL